MKIIRHTARDMRQALRAVREQLGEDAVILSSRRTGDGVEVTAAVDFDASTLEAGGFSGTPAVAALPAPIPAPSFAPPPASAGLLTVAGQSAGARRSMDANQSAPAGRLQDTGRSTGASQSTASGRSAAATNSTVLALTTPRGAKANRGETAGAAAVAAAPAAPAAARVAPPVAARSVAARASSATAAAAAALAAAAAAAAEDDAQAASEPAPSYDTLAALEREPTYTRAYDADWISEAARQAVAEHVAAPRAPLLAPAPPIAESAPTRGPAVRQTTAHVAAHTPSHAAAAADIDPVEQVREDTLTPLASNEIKATFAQFQTPAAATAGATDAMGSELKTLRRMLETQLAHLAWNDLSRRAPVHTEILRELTEIGISQDLAEHLARQLPEDTDITFARRFTIAGLSQYLKVTGDRWLDDGGRVAFAGATGVGKTTTLAKIAVRWVLRHGPRDIALIAADSVRIGAQDQLQSLAQLLGVPVYTPDKFESLPSLLSSLNERLILIDTPGSSVRDPQLANRLAVLSNAASKLETALVLAASTQAGAIEEAVKHFAPANPSCCVLTKLDEAASLGGVLSVLIRARLPVSYMSEGQRVPEDLRPARALELVSAAVRLAKARGAAADEDLLRRRFGKTAHGIS